MDAFDPLRLAFLRLGIDEQPVEELPTVAAEALTRGLDSPSLRELAGASAHAPGENRELLKSAMSELGADVPTPTAAREELVRYWAAEVVAGSLSPYEGASRIWWSGWEELGRPEKLTVFVFLASEWEDDPKHRADYERDIVAAAQQLVAE
jgi:hypothetical protein